MADIELVIKISEEKFNTIKSKMYCGIYDADLYKAIVNGVPLPKGHGRLIDAEAFQKSYCESNCGNRKCVDAMDECIFIGDLQLAPTIIEADKEERK